MTAIVFQTSGIQEGTAFRGGQHFANFYCTSFKTNISCNTEGTVYHRKLCNMSLYFSKILELTVCRIIKINTKVYMSLENMLNKLHLTDATSYMFSKLCLGSI